MKILYVGPLYSGSTALHRRNALAELGHQVLSVDTSIPIVPFDRGGWMCKMVRRILARLMRYVDLKRIHSRIRRNLVKQNPDLLWVDKGQFLRQKELVEFRRMYSDIIWVNYSPDDMMNPRNQTEDWLSSVGLYDVMVTTKSYNVPELKELGAKRVILAGNGFETSVHYPVRDDELITCKHDVVFIGAAEAERVEMIRYLVENGVSVTVYGYGPGWRKVKRGIPTIKIKEGFIADAEYRKALVSSKIALCFLRKQNRDLQTTRSVEIPACGVFMLAERTSEHLELFEDGVNAEFFEGKEELLQKTVYYLEHQEERRLIAKAGYERCHSGGYSNKERLRPVIDTLGNTRERDKAQD